MGVYISDANGNLTKYAGGAGSSTDIDINSVANNINRIDSVLNKTEQVETIYDKDGGSSLDWGYSGGLQFTGESAEYSHDFNKYKRIFISGNSKGTSFILWVDLTSKNTSANANNYQTSNAYDCVYDSGYTNKLWIMRTHAIINNAKTTIRFKCKNSIIDTESNREAQINKIMGWY